MENDTTKRDGDTPRDFAEWMRDHRRGAALYEMSAGLRSVVEAVANTQKKGTLTLTITITPDEQLGIGAVMVSDQIDAKLPKPTKAKSLFYIDGNWDLQRHDPGQMRIPDPSDEPEDEQA